MLLRLVQFVERLGNEVSNRFGGGAVPDGSVFKVFSLREGFKAWGSVREVGLGAGILLWILGLGCGLGMRGRRLGFGGLEQRF